MGKFKEGDRVRVIQIIPMENDDLNEYRTYLNEVGVIQRIFLGTYSNNVKFDNSNLRDNLCFDDKELILNNVNRRVMR